VSVTAEQLLHGYADGHRLLAASTRLPTEIARRLLVESDVAPGGPEDRVISSISLPVLDMWGLTATWAAPEVDRAGSVWSHTILLTREALGALKGLGGLAEALRRPRGPNDIAKYRRPTIVEDRPARSGDQRILRALLLAIYGWPEAPTSVIAEDLPSAEDAVLAVWEQEWPDLRFDTTFATRRRLETMSDHTVQIGRLLARGMPPDAVVVRSDQELPSPPWVQALLDDLESRVRIRPFLWSYGPEATNGRAAVPPLVRISEALSFRGDVTAFAEVARAFPQPRDMSLLKADCLAKDGHAWDVPESTRLLAAIEFGRAIEADAFRIGARTAALWPDLADVSRLVLATRARRVVPAVRTEVVSAVAEVADGNLVSKIASSSLRMAVELCRAAPRLVSDWRTWNPPAPWQLKLIGRLKGIDVDRPVLAAVLVESERSDLVSGAVGVGLLAPIDILGAVSAGGANQGSVETLERVLPAAALDEALQELANHESPIVDAMIAVASFAPSVTAVVHVYRDRLILHLGEADDFVRLRVEVALFCDAYTRVGGGSDVIRATFPDLHRAAVVGAFPSEAWDRLDHVLPAGNHWDRAERLRKALLEVIQRDDWREPEIADVVRASGPEAERIRDLTDKKSELRKVLDVIWEFWNPL
jgi:hypothetical protein